MTPSDDELRNLLKTYLDRSTRKDTPSSDAQMDASDRVRDFIRNDPETCWRFLELARAANLTDEDLAFISAGPFEDLLGAHGEQFIDRVELAARQDERMRFLVATVWEGEMTDAVWQRLETLRARLGIVSL